MTDTCSTCKHWKHAVESYDPYISKWDGLVPEDDLPQWGWCDLIGLPSRKDIGYGDPLPPTLTAFTKDGSDYKADLHCRADFGCTLHELAAPDTEGRGRA